MKIWTLPGCIEVELIRAGNLRGPLLPQVSFACKLVYLEQGAREFQYGQRRLTAHTGALLLIPPGEVHGAEVSADPCAIVRVLSIENAAFSQIADGRFHLPAALSPFIADDAAVAAFRRLHRSPVFKSVLEAQFLLMTLLECLVPPQPHRQAPVLGNSDMSRIHRVKRYLEEHYAEDVTLPQLADLAGLAPSYLCRAFKQTVGVPPHAYLVAVRIARVRVLLAQGMAAGQAALEAGFYDQAHLTRAFTRALQMPPMEYARQVRR